LQLALLQPQFAPNLYDLASMLNAGRVIWQDSERWSRKSRCHRAMVRTQRSTQWINLPIVTEDKGKAINQVRIDHDQNWFDPLWNALVFNYRNSIYFEFYEPEIRADFKNAFSMEYLIDFDLFFFKRLCRYLEIDIHPELSSELEYYSPDPDELARELGADGYFQEHEARNYQRQGVRAETALTNHPKYRQHFGGFEQACCVLDLLFEYGPESFRVLEQLQ